jgi:type IV pilus assembly protein PilO
MTKEMKQNLMAVGIFIVIVLVVYFKYLINPINKKYAEADEQLSKVESKIVAMKQRARELPKLQREMKLLEAEVTELEKRLPKEKGIQQLLRLVTKDAQAYKINILTFTPNEAAEKANYTEIPFRISVRGSYHSLAQFFADLGQESRIISARNLTMTADSTTKNDTVTASFTIVAYMFKG